MLVLRTCADDMSSNYGFVWPESGPVECADWHDDYRCGHGLHGLPWGEGDGSLLCWKKDAKWLVVEVADADVRHGQDDMTRKCKFPRGVVVFCGDRKGATDYILANGGARKSVVGATRTAGDYGQASAGYRGQASAGEGGQASAGEYGLALVSHGGSVKADKGGVLVLLYWDEKKGRPRAVVGYVGEEGIKAGVLYRLNDEHRFVTVE